MKRRNSVSFGNANGINAMILSMKSHILGRFQTSKLLVSKLINFTFECINICRGTCNLILINLFVCSLLKLKWYYLQYSTCILRPTFCPQPLFSLLLYETRASSIGVYRFFWCLKLSGLLLLVRVIAATLCVTLAASLAARRGSTTMAAFHICLQIWLATSLLADGLAVAGQVSHVFLSNEKQLEVPSKLLGSIEYIK